MRPPDNRDAREIISDLLEPNYRVVGRAPVPALPPRALMTPGRQWRGRGGRS